MTFLVVSPAKVVNNLASTLMRHPGKSQGMSIADRIRRVLEVREWSARKLSEQSGLAGSSLLSNALIVCVLAIVIFASVCLLWSQIVRDAPSPPPVTAGRGVGHDATVTAPIPQPTAPVRPARHRHDASVHRPR